MNKRFIKFKFVTYRESLRFGFNQQNRAINHSHLAKIQKQCMESFDIMPPIIVNMLTGNLIDGQHRTKAYQLLVENGQLPKETKLKVMFVEIPIEEEKEAIINANCNVKTWTLDDYISSYAKAGIESYVALDEWCKAHSLSCDNGKSKFRYGAAIITGKRSASELKAGNFNFTDDQLEKADNVHAEMVEIVDMFGIKGKGPWLESLATSWTAVREQHDFRTWMRELKAKKRRFMNAPKDNSGDWDNIFAQVHLAIDKKHNG